MSIMSGSKLPKGYEMFQVPTRGGQSASTYSMLSQFFPELLQQAKGAPGAFEAMEQQGQNLFEQKLAPGIAQRYAGSGIGSSSGMQNAIAAAGKDVTLGLQAQRANLMQNSMKNVLNLGKLLLSNPDQQTFFGREEEKPSFWEQMLGIGLPIAGTAAGFIPGFGPMIGGPAGGAKIGSTIAQAFNRR